MDPLTQGTLGAVASQAFARDPGKVRWVFLLGFIGGMAPDLDVFIRSQEDPLLFLEFHRQFTHSLIFIPIGGLLVAGLLFGLFRRQLGLSFRQCWWYATLGYATHGLLDSSTSYGTQLFWPFTDFRVSWNSISIIDPLFTGPLLVLILVAFWRRSPRTAQIAVAYALCYLALGFAQTQRAQNVAFELAAERGHTPTMVTAKPSFGNLILWKLIYQHDGRFYVDAVRLLGDTTIFEGESIERLPVDHELDWLAEGSTQARDLERFRWFSQDYIAQHPENPLYIIDVRYSMLPNEIRPLWGILMDPEQPNKHVTYVHNNERDSGMRQRFLDMLFLWHGN